MAQYRDLYQEITDNILEALESGKKLPWRKPWRDGGLIPRNGNTGRPYNGVNVFHLMAIAASKGYESNDWFTFHGVKAAGGKIKKGEKHSINVFWKLSKVRDDKAKDGTKMIPFLKHHCVFNRDQCTGLEDHNIDGDFVELDEAMRLHNVEEFIAQVDPKLSDGVQACYRPSLDDIKMPPFGSFNAADGYYSTLMHEMSHWTGHKDRLDRDLTGRFGDRSYSAEELVAEFSSAFLCNVLKVDGEDKQHEAYIQSWIKLLKSDKKAIVKCCSEAQKASNYLLEAGGVTIWEDEKAEAVA